MVILYKNFVSKLLTVLCCYIIYMCAIVFSDTIYSFKCKKAWSKLHAFTYKNNSTAVFQSKFLF